MTDPDREDTAVDVIVLPPEEPEESKKLTRRWRRPTMPIGSAPSTLVLRLP